MRSKEKKILASILKESPIYSELDGDERRVVMKGLIRIYPRFFNDEQENIEVGYEASWLGTQS